MITRDHDVSADVKRPFEIVNGKLMAVHFQNNI